MASGFSLGKHAVAVHALLLAVLLVAVGRELGGVEASCDTNAIKLNLSACISALNSTPDYKSQCCQKLRSIHDTLKPDDQCICGILSDTQVVNAGLTKDKAKTFIEVCVGAYALPSCLKGV